MEGLIFWNVIQDCYLLKKNLLPSDSSENLDLLIAFRKGTRTCKSTYPIANFVSYDHLSSASRSLIVSLGSFFVPKIVKEALHHPGWSEVIPEEIHALGKSHVGFGGFIDG